MRAQNKYKINISRSVTENDLVNGIFLSIIHAKRIPPHIGMIINNCYHSLTIKGQEINQRPEILIKNSRIRQIPSLFIKIKSHPIFSSDYLNEHFISNVGQFQKVEAGKTTCLSPVKLFFEETYNLSMSGINYVFDLLPLLEKNGLIENITSMNIEGDEFQLPVYSFDEINTGIDKAMAEIREIKDSKLKLSDKAEIR
jgi:hypothetical protein